MVELSLIQEKSRRIQLLKRISIGVFSLLILTGYSVIRKKNTLEVKFLSLLFYTMSRTYQVTLETW